MHEWALAEAIVSTVSKIADEEGLKEVSEVQLKLGELQQVEKRILMFALSHMKTGKLNNMEITIKTVKAKFMCRICQHTWSLKEAKLADEVKESIHFIPEVAYAYIRCLKCGSPDFEILQGRGMWIVGVRGIK
ncbi:MAG: hydrogenase nickel incorporation protein HypA [Candidatus Bathyarchaeia archaeon]